MSTEIPYLRRAVLLAMLIATGCQPGNSTDSASRSGVVCVDVDTQEVVLLEETIQYPARNPNTGTNTLVPALYCEDCQTWHPAPSMEQLHRQRGVAYCPKTGRVLTADGPLPDATRAAP